jgi:hypothetical protein
MILREAGDKGIIKGVYKGRIRVIVKGGGGVR